MNEIDREFWSAVLGLTLVMLLALGIVGGMVLVFYRFSVANGGG